MARYNKIYAGGVRHPNPQVTEAPASEAITPGTAIVLSSGEFAVAGASSNEKIFIAQDNYLAMKTTEDAYAVDDVCLGLEMLDEQLFNVVVPTGNNLAKGAALTTDASGKFVPATTVGNRIIAHADEAYNNDTGSDQLVRVRPAKSNLAVPA